MNFNKQSFPWRIFYRLISIQSALILAAILITGLSARSFFKSYVVEQIMGQLKDSLVILTNSIDDILPADWCAKYARGTKFRLSLLDSQGNLLCDSESRSLEVEAYKNEADVLKVREVNTEDYFASKMEEEYLYGSLLASKQRLILRGALSIRSLKNAIRVFDTTLGLIFVSLFLTLIIVALLFTRHLVFPLGRILEKTQKLLRNESSNSIEDLNQDSFGEWSELESHLDSLKKNIENTSQTLSMGQIELDVLMTSISDAVLAVTKVGQPMFYNGRFEMVFGKIIDATEKKYWELFREPEFLQFYERALSKGYTGSSRARCVESLSGGKRYFVLSVSPLRREGEIYGALGLFHDVTELKMAEQMRIDFVANVSHELRTPLTSIKGYTETLIEDVKLMPLEIQKTSLPEFLNVIARNTGRLMNLMGDLLDLSSIESVEILHKEKIMVSDVTERVHSLLADRLLKKNQMAKFNYQTDSVVADANRLEQVLVNLLDNAIKYSPLRAHIEITWSKEPGSVILKVKDSGPGISLEHQQRLFERFYRVDKARSREQGGTGLGLAIVKHIMQRHEGNVWVESQPGKGTTFVCKFPEGSMP